METLDSMPPTPSVTKKTNKRKAPCLLRYPHRCCYYNPKTQPTDTLEYLLAFTATPISAPMVMFVIGYLNL